MRTGEVEIVRGGEADIGFVMATERLEGYDALVGRSEAQQHAAALADGRHAYFIGRAAGEPVGFVIIRDWRSWDGVSLVKRVAVVRPGEGFGSAMLRLVVDRVFLETEAHRLTIGMFPENLRARRAYERVGFLFEGIARGSVFMHGRHHDELVMAMLRPDWERRRV